MKRYINNEEGSGVLLTLFSFAIVGAMLILVLNIAMVFTKKEQASIAAENASLAATSVVYEYIDTVVQSHVKEVIIGVDENGVEIIKYEPLIEKVLNRESALRFSHPWLSDNEIYIKAINEVLISEIPDDEKLPGKISSALHSAQSSIPSVIEHIIDENIGEETDFEYEWKLDDNYRIEVIAKLTSNAVDYNSMDFGDESVIPQRGKGPTISFIEASGW
jgi:hypothetical protein